MACLLELPLIWDGVLQLAVHAGRAEAVRFISCDPYLVHVVADGLVKLRHGESIATTPGLRTTLPPRPERERRGELVVRAAARACIGRVECIRRRREFSPVTFP